LIVLFVPFKRFEFIPLPLWSWNIDAMGTLVFNVLAILLIVAAVLVNKLGNGGLRVGSLGIDQFISVLAAVAFTYAFVDLVTSVPYWHVGAYLAFFAALVAFFAGVFTMLPFFGKEFDARESVQAHPKARPVGKRAQHPAPQANVPGAQAAAFGSAPGQDGWGAQGQPGPQGQFGAQGQFGGQGQEQVGGQSGQFDSQSGSGSFDPQGQQQFTADPTAHGQGYG
ncbi:hypothetical protein ACFXPS_44900, partial [Nocardia sp. NPDC059091]